jgi:carbon monoxide dehydrogenase subunit G
MAFGLAAAFAGGALAHGPTRQKVVEKINVDAPAAAVWDKLKAFDALAQWHPAVAASPADKGNQVGSVRTIALKGGGEIVETLESYSDEQRRYTYRAKDGGALPVSNYTSTIQVSPDGDTKSVVEWRGAFYRAFPGNDPPADKNDEAAVKAVTGVYQAGLANLKKQAEGK